MRFHLGLLSQSLKPTGPWRFRPAQRMQYIHPHNNMQIKSAPANNVSSLVRDVHGIRNEIKQPNENFNEVRN